MAGFKGREAALAQSSGLRAGSSGGHGRPHHGRLLARLRCYARDMSHALLVLSTCPDAESAGRIARALVEERLAACVNRLAGVDSTYHWQGKVLEEREVLLVIKTRRERFDALRDRLLELHPHEVPELVALEIPDGYRPYLDWIAAETGP